MSTAQAVILIGGGLAVIIVMLVVCIWMDRINRQRVERRRKAWEEAGCVDPYPDMSACAGSG